MDSVVRVEGADCLETFLGEHLKVSGRVCSPERGFQPPFEGWLQLGQYRFLFGILLQERIRTKKTEQKVELKRISTNLLLEDCCYEFRFSIVLPFTLGYLKTPLF